MTNVGLSLLRPAQLLTELHWRVFPVGSGGSPLIENYHGDEEFPPEVLRSFPWSKAQALGVALPSDLFALDIDVKHSKPGFQSLDTLEAEIGALPKTFCLHTSSGGQHRIFRTGSSNLW